MSSPAPEPFPHPVDELLARRLRIAFYIALAANLLFVFVDLAFRGLSPAGLYLAKLPQFVAIAGTLWALRRPGPRTQPTRITLVAFTIICFMAAVQGNIVGDAQTIPLLLGSTLMGLAALVPWGARPQAAAAAVATIATLWNLVYVHGGFQTTLGYPVLTMFIAGLASVLIAYELARWRNSLARAQDELRTSEQSLRRIFDQLQDVYYRVDTQGILRMVSPSVERFGYRASDLIGRDAEIFYRDPADRQRMVKALAEDRSVTDFELTLKHRDGSAVPTSVSSHLLFDDQGQIVGVEGLLRDITLRKRNEQHLSALIQVGRDVSGSLDLSDILDRVQRSIVEFLPCDGVVTFRFDRAENVYRVTTQHGVSPNTASLLQDLTLPPSAPFGDRLRAGETVVANRLDGYPSEMAEAMGGFTASAVAVTPLLVHDNLFGALVAFKRGNDRFDAEQTQLLESIARQVAVAAETVELYRAKQEDAEVAGALAEIGRALISSHSTTSLHELLCDTIQHTLGCDFSSTFVLQPAEDVFRAVAVHEEVKERADALRLLEVPATMVPRLVARLGEENVVQILAKETQDLVSAFLLEQFDITAVLCIALRRQGQLVGILSAGYHGREAFTEQQLRIARGITEIASLAFESARLVEELEAADRFRADFIATMSHEIRTPLGVTLGYLELLLDEQFGPLNPEQMDTLARAGRSARELLDLITATLDLSRMESKRIPLDRSDIDVAALLGELTQEMQLLTRNPALRLEWDIAEGLPDLHTDRVKLRMVLKNLIGNALKFTDEGCVSVSAAPSAGGVELTVADTGPGIPPTMQETIFEPFRQGDHRQGGAGLGLYIVRRLLAAMDGTITLDSEVGRGSSFRVWVPVPEA